MNTLNELLKLNLQLFSEADKTGSNDASDNNPDVDNTDGKSDEVVFDEKQQEYINKLISQTKSKAKDEHERGIDEKVKEILKKEKDYAKLSEKEREMKEFEDERNQFLKERQEFEHSKLLISIEKDLIEKNLPLEFAEYLAVKGDSEKSLENVGVFEKKFNESVSKAVKDALKQPNPNDGRTDLKHASLGATLAKDYVPSGKIFE